MIAVQLHRSMAGIDAVTRRLERLVKTLHEEEQRDRDSSQAKYWRGALHDTTWLLGVFCGESVRDEILMKVGQATQLPIPHVARLEREGNQFAIDTEPG